MNSVDLENVTKIYSGSTPSVDDLSLTVGDGEFFTLLGPSGCGKSTTLRMIAGFINPTSGNIRFGERDVTNLPPHKRDTGMVFQNYALFPHMDVAGNVAYGLSMRRVAKEEKRTRIAEALEIVGLTDYAVRRIDQLSGGQQQRVAVARALVSQPDVIVADEPTGNLDSNAGEEVLSILRSSVDELGQTVVMVTHDPRAAARADRVVLLADGRLAGELSQPDPESVATALMNVTAAAGTAGSGPARSGTSGTGTAGSHAASSHAAGPAGTAADATTFGGAR